MAVRLNDRVYGVVGLVLGDQVLDAFENSILLSILGECALALENARNAQEKEEAAALARNEQIRAKMISGSNQIQGEGMKKELTLFNFLR